ncbi:MAG: ribonuclease HII [Candidatus Promineifilaceae bacterium]|nr:ribonuclease HII [Candidatus Promineifilaceae bacterium]
MPNLKFERSVNKDTGITRIAGLDEAGRGALAGPVVAAAVILPLDNPKQIRKLSKVDDSKRLAAKDRALLFDLITKHAWSFGVGKIEAARIDEVGIIPATKLAMLEALAQLNPQAQYLLVDGRLVLKSTPLPQQAIIRGDSRSMSIAAASILAKVTRDRLMEMIDQSYPDYGFAAHKGYGTQFHRDVIGRLGPIAEHRRSFAPMRLKLL